MSPRIGRPPKENPRDISLNIRLTKEEASLLQDCANKLKIPRTDVIMIGVQKVATELKSKK